MLFALIHLLAGTVLAGVFVLVVVAVPSFYDAGMTLIPYAALAGFVLAFPVAYVVTKQMSARRAVRQASLSGV
jgi:ABC-type bacteriocin/lantibiotic exporter with double-glycine peptidase domain